MQSSFKPFLAQPPVPAAPRLAKLSIPRASGALVRSRLHHALDHAVQRAAVWIAAGPGAGKSTLAASWTASRSGRALWFRADEGDTDPAVAFGYFRELARAPRGKALPTFIGRELDRLDLFARTFFRAFFAITPAASTLVIDDAHAAASERFNTLLAAAIDEAPHDVALLVLSRQDPAGPLLDQVSRGALQVIDANALAFTADEATELLSDQMDRAAARRLQAKVDGWAAGLLLLSTAEANGDDRLIGRERIATYFEDRVLAQFDAEALRTLTALSLLPEVDGRDIHELGFDDRAIDLLERLRKRHAFVARLDRQPASWRLHDLLRDALRARFDSAEDAVWRNRAVSTAARIASGKGLAREAVALWLRCDRTDDARRTADRFARALVRAQRLDELDAIVALLDPAAVESSVPLQFALGESAWQRNDPGPAAERLERAFTLLHPRAPSETALVIAATAFAVIIEGWRDYAGTDRWVARIREHLPARDGIADASEALRVDSVCVQTMSTIWSGAPLGDHRALIDRVLAALRTKDVTPDEAVAASTILLETAAYRFSDKQLYLDTLQASSAWLFRPDLSPLALASWLSAFAALVRHWPVSGMKLPAENQIDCLELAVTLGREHGGQTIAFVATDFLVNAAISNNDVALASRRLASLRELLNPAHVSQVHSVLSAEASLFALQGDFVRAREACDRAIELSEVHDFPMSERWGQALGRGRIDIAAGRFAEAREWLLSSAVAFPEGMRKDFALILADVAAAGEALRSQGQVPAPLVEKIIRAAAAYSWRGFATLMTRLSARLCADALRLGIEPEFARQVIREKNIPAPAPFEAHWPWPVRIYALGGLRVLVNDAPLAFGPRAQRKPLDLLKAIIAHGPAPVDSAVILDALWPDAEGASARAAFDMTLMRLRKLLQRDDALDLDAGHVSLGPACVWVDAYAFARGASDEYAGPLFGSDAIEPWWAAARERLHQRFLRRTLERGRAHESAHDLEGALAIYEAGLAQDPLAEDLYQGAIRCHLGAGRPADALRVFRRCREQLSIILAVPPSPATAALVARLSTS